MLHALRITPTLSFLAALGLLAALQLPSSARPTLAEEPATPTAISAEDTDPAAQAAVRPVAYLTFIQHDPAAAATPTPQPTKTSTAQPAKTPTPQPTTTAVPSTTELVVYDWTRPVTKDERGFPRNRPPIANGSWLQPVNYAEGTLYFRAEIRSQPVPQQMRLQYCVWQDDYALESCGPLADVAGTPGTVVTWSVPVQSMWKKDLPIDWSRARDIDGVAVKDSGGKPISDYNGWNWNGANPDAWYPLDMRFTVVVVAKGATFGGWDRYAGK